MKCKCSLDNSYEVIGLCDIEKFNEKINEFASKSYAQITLSEIVCLPFDKPSIKRVEKIYLDIKINATKVIKTPTSNKANFEGLKLSGKLLLVSGTLYQNIIYASDTSCNSLHSFKFNTHFSTNIILKEDATLYNDIYCIYPFIEYVSLNPLDEKKLQKNIAVFLFAQKIHPPTTFLSKLIFKSENNQEMANVEFDINNKKLIVTSTGIVYKSSFNNDPAFVFKLETSTGEEKISKTIEQDENADSFKDDLNDYPYNPSDIIDINLNKKGTLALSNYPDLGDNYSITELTVKFTISKTGISPILYPNKITVKSKNNEEVLTIELDANLKIFIISSKGVIPDPSSNDPYLTFILKDKNGADKIKAILNSNEDASNFKALLNNKKFILGEDILALIYKDKNKIEITNYPNIGSKPYVPTDDFNIFKIDMDKFKDISINSKINIFSDNNQKMSTLYFFKNVNKYPNRDAIEIISTSTPVLSTTTGEANKSYASFLSYAQLDLLKYEEIQTRATAKSFSDNLYGYNVIVSSLHALRLSSKIPNKIVITNYNNQAEYKVGEEPEFIDSTNYSFRKYDLDYNKIRFKNSDGSSILFIYFDSIGYFDIFMLIHSTGVINKDSDNFSFKLLTKSGSTRFQGTINKGETGDLIQIGTGQFSKANISSSSVYNHILELNYSNGSLIEITDFPDVGSPIYNPPGNSQRFKITPDGLELVTI